MIRHNISTICAMLTAAALCAALCGCADMTRMLDKTVAPHAVADSESSAAWQKQWDLLAAAAESPTSAEEHARVLDAMEHAAAMRDGSAVLADVPAGHPTGEARVQTPVASTATAPPTATAPTPTPTNGVIANAKEAKKEIDKAEK